VPLRRAPGFTLLEMLVVIAVIGLMTAAAILSLRVLGGDDPAKRSAQQLQQKLLAARDLAELEQRAVGLYINQDGYEFFAYSVRWGAWRPISNRALSPEQWPEGVEVDLFIEGRVALIDDSPESPVSDTVASETPREPLPQLGVAANGEFTIFEVKLRPSGSVAGWVLRPDAASELQLTPPATS
jgi:general secretion pathway protein H